MKTLYLMCGLSFSGKSTLAAAMVRKLHYTPISLDDINQERSVGFGGDGIAVEEWERTHHIAIGRLEDYMQTGHDIVLDDTNCFRWIRDRFRSVAAKNGYRTLVIYLDIPLPILQERMLKNEATQERRAVKEPIFAELSRQFEVPGSDEPTLIFTLGDTVDEWIKSRLESLIMPSPSILPQSISDLILPQSLEQEQIGKSQSDVFKVQLRNQDWAYLKISSSRYVAEEIHQEIKVLHWLKAKLPVPTPILVAEDFGKIHLLLSALPGDNLVEAAKSMTANECLIAGTRFLRKWHSVPISNCPFDRSLPVGLRLARQNCEAGLVDEADFDVERSGKTAQEVYAELLGEVPPTEDLVFTHGDFCLPNLIFNHGETVGAVDLGRAGMADRHQDIALFLRSFQSNVGRPELDLFLREYQLVHELDFKKLAFYRILDEFF